MSLNYITAEDAASMINHLDNVGFSGFTPAGSPKAISLAIAEKAIKQHEANKPFKIGVITGASTGDSLDGALARANAVLFRTPYQSNSDMRKVINSNETEYFDMHLSILSQNIRYGNLGKIKWGVIEACEVTEDGEIVLTSGVGIAPTICNVAEGLFIELNEFHSKELKGFHDIYEPLDPPNRREIPIYKPSDRIGSHVIKIDKSKIIGIVRTNLPDEVKGFDDTDKITEAIGYNVADFLSFEYKKGRIPKSFLPLQSGVGNIANCVLGSLGKSNDIPQFEMFTEVIQDSVIELMKSDKIKFASGSSLTVSNKALDEIYSNINFFRERLLLRPQEISNNPEIVRRLGIITMNTAIEADIFGNVNSTQILGSKMMNGVGGSCDFTRNAYISIFSCPSVAKGGAISAIVPMASHIDQSEHSVQVIITERGIADLRAKSPNQRAKIIIDNCAHPDYKELLNDYIKLSNNKHTPANLSKAFSLHIELEKSGDMRNAKF